MTVAENVAMVCRRYADISEKLGGLEEAADAMGKLVRDVASRLASEGSIREVSPGMPYLDLCIRQQIMASLTDEKENSPAAWTYTC